MMSPSSLTAVVLGCGFALVAFSDSAGAIDHKTLGQVCKATIAKVMGRDPAIIKVVKVASGVAHVRYTRSDDGTVWSMKCQVDGSSVTWATETGRWRNDPEDSVVTYKVEPDAISITETFSDGSGDTESYSAAVLN